MGVLSTSPNARQRAALTGAGPDGVDFAGVAGLAQELIRMPSLPGKEGAVAALLADAMNRCGFHEVWTDSAGNAIGRYRGQRIVGNPRVLRFDDEWTPSTSGIATRRPEVMMRCQ